MNHYRGHMEESLAQYVDKIIEDGIITTEEHDKFMELVHADGKIDEQESAQISRVFQLISSGKVKVVDIDRDKVDREKIQAAKEEVLKAEEESMQRNEELKAATAAKASSEEELKRKKAVEQKVKEAVREQEASRNKIAEYFDKRKA